MNKTKKRDLNSYFGKHILICNFCGKCFIKKMDILTHCLIHRVKTATLKSSTKLKLSIKRDVTFEYFFKNVDLLQNGSKPKGTRNDLDTDKFKGNSQKPSSIKRPQFLHCLAGGNSHKLSNMKKPQKIRYHKCEICSEHIKTIYSLKGHIKIPLRDKTCTRKPKRNFCEREFKKLTRLRDHVDSHTGERPYGCKLCPKTFRYPQDLKRHTLYHTDETPFSCQICSKHFRHKTKLKKHITNCHADEKPLGCEICPKHFTEEKQLKQHLDCHNDQKPFKCEQCLKGFASRSALETHRRDHASAKPFGCKICSKNFRFEPHLRMHLSSHNNGNTFKSIECPNCCMTFNQKPSLYAHLNNRHCNILQV